MTEEEFRLIADRVAKFEDVPYLTSSHTHLEKGCMCGSCNVYTGVLISIGRDCDDHPEFKHVWESSCDVPVLDWEQANHLVKLHEEAPALLREVGRLQTENRRLREKLEGK